MTTHGYVATLVDILSRPRAFFTALGDEPTPAKTYVGPVRFAVLVSLVVAPATTVVRALVDGDAKGAVGGVVASALLGPLLTLVGVYVTAALVHTVLRLTRGAARPFATTLGCVGYASAPVVAAVVPVVGPIASALWQIGLLVYALARAQRAGAVRAAIAALVDPAFFVALALLLRLFVVESFKIPSGSMVPTLAVGDHLFVTKLAYASSPPKRSDVVVFRFPENRAQDFVKRVVATAGETIEVVDGRPVVDGKRADACYVGAYSTEGHESHLYVEAQGSVSYLTQHDHALDLTVCTSDATCGAGRVCRGGACGILQGPFKVAAGEVFVMGDNRDNAFDSRMWHQGLGAGVPLGDVKGRFALVWMGFDEQGAVDRSRVGASPSDLRLPAAARQLGPALDRCVAELARR
jgi:signal peptidase I